MTEQGSPEVSVTELERAEMVGELVAATSPKTVETLMKCVLPDGRDHLATKNDLKVLEHATKKDLKVLELATKKDLKVLEHAVRADFAELRAHVDSSLAESKADFAELRAHVDSSLAELKAEIADLKAHNEAMHGKQTRLLMTSLAGFAISTWTPMLVFLAV